MKYLKYGFGFGWYENSGDSYMASYWFFCTRQVRKAKTASANPAAPAATAWQLWAVQIQN